MAKKDKKRQRPSLGEAILAITRLYGKVVVESGIVTVCCDNGESWDFTEPMLLPEKKK